jgi:hypothetical protein
MARAHHSQRPTDESNLVAFPASLPAAPEAERTLLGAVFSDCIGGQADAPSLRAAIAEGIGPRHFQDPTHRLIFQSMRHLLQENLPPDLTGLWQHIGAEHGEVNARTREVTLALSRDPISTLHARGAIDQLKRAEASRQQLRAAHELQQSIMDGDEERQREARRQIATAGQEDRGGLPRIISAADLVAKECPTPAVLISGLLHRGAKLLLGGGSKSYKSWALIDLAVSVASGSPFWGLATSASRVLYLNFEIVESFFRGRIMDVAKAKAVNIPTMAKGLDVWTLRGHAADLALLVPHIVAQAAGRDYGLIVLDPIYKCLAGRPENDAGAISELLNEVEKLAHRTGAAVVIAHHFAKGSAAAKESLDRMSGSGVWARDPDALVTLTPHEDEGAFTVDCTLRNFAPLSPFCVQWGWPLMLPAADLDPAALKQAPGRPKEWASGDVLALLPAGGASFSAWADIAAGKGVSESTFKRRVKELVELRAVNLVNKLYIATGRGGAS